MRAQGQRLAALPKPLVQLIAWLNYAFRYLGFLAQPAIHGGANVPEVHHSPSYHNSCSQQTVSSGIINMLSSRG